MKGIPYKKRTMLLAKNFFFFFSCNIKLKTIPNAKKISSKFLDCLCKKMFKIILELSLTNLDPICFKVVAKLMKHPVRLF